MRTITRKQLKSEMEEAVKIVTFLRAAKEVGVSPINCIQAVIELGKATMQDDFYREAYSEWVTQNLNVYSFDDGMIIGRSSGSFETALLDSPIERCYPDESDMVVEGEGNEDFESFVDELREMARTVSSWNQ